MVCGVEWCGEQWCGMEWCSGEQIGVDYWIKMECNSNGVWSGME